MRKVILWAALCLGSFCNANLIGHWGLDEQTGSIVHDSLGAHDGTLVNYYGNPWTSGPVDGALGFDGVNDHVDMGNATTFNNLDQITISSWINLTQEVSDRHFVFGKEFVFKIDVEYQKVRFLLGNDWNDWSGSRQTSHQRLSLNQWYHVAATYDGEYKRIFINGVNTDTMYAPIDGGIGGNDRIVTIGALHAIPEGYMNFFKGFIDDVAIYDEALTQEQIHSIMTDGALSVPEPNTLVLLGLSAVWIRRAKRR